VQRAADELMVAIEMRPMNNPCFVSYFFISFDPTAVKLRNSRDLINNDAF
jgi:hypothetical protein